MLLILQFFFFLALFPILLYSQDTSFVAKHLFKTPVRNVFKTGNSIYVKTGDGLYKGEDNKWVPEKRKFEKPFVFYDKGFYEADYIPDQFIFDARSMAYLIPQQSLSSPTLALLDDKLFVSVGGSLFEYSINKFWRHLYKKYSIRDIYIEDTLKVVSTYSGIFINDTIKAASPLYSSGSFCRIMEKYYLCSDPLFEYTWPSTFRKIETGMNVFAGHSRKLVEYHDTIYSQNTKSINFFNSAFELIPIHQRFEYYDLEVIDSLLLFCTSTGEVFQYDGKKNQLLFDVNTRVRDIYTFGNMVYFSTDVGVYTLQNMRVNSLKLLAALPLSVMVVIDIQHNLWIATENGLYILPYKRKEPIPFIEGVEFNRGALTYFDDHIYAGSIEGLYVIDIYTALRNFLPLYLDKQRIAKNQSARGLLIISSMVVLLALLGSYFYYIRNRKATRIIPIKEETVFTLDKIEQDIKSNNIMTVEGLAEYYNTNPVQLNRLFKTFNTTPGKFMKKVKLNLAQELLKSGVKIEEVVTRVGYSAYYLKKELHL